MKSIFFLAFLFALASAKVGVFLGGDFSPVYSKAFFKCAAASPGLNLTILEIWDEKGNTNQNFLSNFINSRDADIDRFDASAVVNDTFEPEAICNGVASALPRNFSGTVWLDIQGKQSLWSRNVSDRIPYLENITKSCRSHGLKPGFYSSAQAWVQVLGDQEAGSDLLKAVPLWYWNQNGNPNFNDFHYASFGPWDTPTMKNYDGSLFCKSLIRGLNYFN